MAWAEFTLAFVVFFVSHSVPVRAPVKPWLVSLLGQRGFTMGYSMLSLAILAWLITVAERAPFVVLWHWAPWQTGVALALMLMACLVLALGLARPNPFSFGGAQNHLFDPQKPGIIRWTRHPLLIGLGLWATAHLIVNGDLAHVVLFGVFACFSGLGGRLVDRRKQREMGEAWDHLRKQMTAQSLAYPMFRVTWQDVLRVCLGVALYLAMIWMHPFITGVSPLG